MKKPLIIGLIIIILGAVSLGMISWQQSRELGIAVATAEVVEDDLVVDVFATGQVELGVQNQIQVRQSGVIVEMNAEVGERVKQGQLLARVDDYELSRRIREAKGNLALQEANLAQLQQGPNESEIEQLKINIEQVQLRQRQGREQVERLKTLVQNGIKPEIELLQAKKELELLQLEVKLAEERLNYLTAGEVAGALGVVKAQVGQAQLAVELLEEQLKATRITAPLEGTVLKKLTEPGQYASAGTPIFLIGDLESIQIRAFISEVDAGRLEVGQLVNIRGRAFLGQEYEGVITKIYPIAESTVQDQTRQTTVAVVIDVKSEETVLKPGYTVELKIIIAMEKEALLVPYEAVVNQDAKQIVFVVGKEGIVEKRSVELGIRNDFFIQITGGLSPGDAVILNPGAELTEGIVVSTSD